MTGVMSSGVCGMAGAPFKHLQTHAPTCAKPMTNLKVLWEFSRVRRKPRFSQRPRGSLNCEGMPRTTNSRGLDRSGRSPGSPGRKVPSRRPKLLATKTPRSDSSHGRRRRPEPCTFPDSRRCVTWTWARTHGCRQPATLCRDCWSHHWCRRRSSIGNPPGRRPPPPANPKHSRQSRADAHLPACSWACPLPSTPRAEWRWWGSRAQSAAGRQG